jgi:hypothetical protein
MSLVEQFAAMANVEVAHLAPDAARVEVATAADAAALRDAVEQRVTPLRETLRGEQPQLAASCA